MPEAAIVFTAEQIRLLQGPVSIMVSTCGPLRRPHVARGIGCCVAADRSGVAVLVQAAAAGQVIDDIRSTGRVAVVFSEPLSNRSLQLKARDARIESIGAAGLELAQAWARGYARQIDCRTPPTWTADRLAAALVPSAAGDLALIAFTPDALFDQTPGPRAGERMPAAATR
jgi:hypothetical protein